MILLKDWMTKHWSVQGDIGSGHGEVPSYCPYRGLPWIREMATNGYVDQESKLRVTLWMMLLLQYWKSTSLCVRMTMK